MAHVIVLAGKDDPRWAEIPALVEAMYAEEAAMGSPATLAPDGADRWLKGIGAGLERFGRLVVAEEGGCVVGFAHGALRLQPDHLAGGPVGSITHVFVHPDHRRGGTARALVHQLDDWFRQRNVDRIELTVVVANTVAAAFWKAMGFSVALQQLVRR